MARTITGIYLCHTGAHVVLASADAAGVGRWFLYNPLSSGITVALRYIEFMAQHGSVLVTATSPRLLVRRFLYTSGTGSGTLITAAKRATSDGTQLGLVRATNAGLTGFAAGADVHAFMPVVALTAVGGCAPAEADLFPDQNGQVVLAEGEGLFLTQVDAGTASDTRRYTTNIQWEEFTGS